MPDPTGGMLARGRGRHRLSRGAQPRHDRRQPRPCRPGGGLADGARRARRRDRAGRRRSGGRAGHGRRASCTGAFATALGADECSRAIRVPVLSPAARAGATGSSAARRAISPRRSAPSLHRSRTRRTLRVVIGATNGAPIVLDDLPHRAALPRTRRRGARRVAARSGGFAAISYAVKQLHAVAARRALARGAGGHEARSP